MRLKSSQNLSFRPKGWSAFSPIIQRALWRAQDGLICICSPRWPKQKACLYSSSKLKTHGQFKPLRVVGFMNSLLTVGHYLDQQFVMLMQSCILLRQILPSLTLLLRACSEACLRQLNSLLSSFFYFLFRCIVKVVVKTWWVLPPQ